MKFNKLMFLIVLMFLISLPVVFGAEPIVSGGTFDSSKTYTFNNRPIESRFTSGWSGQFTVQGSAFTINGKRYVDDGTQIVNMQGGTSVGGPTPGQKVYNRAYSGTTGSGVSGRNPRGTRTRTETYIYEKDGVVQVRVVTYEGNSKVTVKDAAGVVLLTYNPSTDSAFRDMDWSKWDGTANNYVTRNGRKITVTPVAGGINPFGENAGDKYEVTSRDGKTTITYEQRMEDGKLVSEKTYETRKVEGETITIDYDSKIVTIPAGLAGSEVTMDSDYFSTISPNWDMTQNKGDGFIYIDSDTRVSIVEDTPGSKRYVTQTEYAGVFVAKEDFYIVDDGAGNRVSTKITYDVTTGNVETSTVQESFNNGELTIVRNYDGGIADENLKGEVVITRYINKGTPNEEKVIVEIDADDFADYQKGQVLNEQITGDILFAYDQLGDDGELIGTDNAGNPIYSTKSGDADNDYKEVVVDANNGRVYTEYEDGNIVDVQFEATVDGATYLVPGSNIQLVLYNGETAKVETEWTSDGKVRTQSIETANSEGHILTLSDQDEGGNTYSTNFDYNPVTGQTTRTITYTSKDGDSQSFMFDNARNVYSSMDYETYGTYFDSFNSEGTPMIYNVGTDRYEVANAGDKVVFEDGQWRLAQPGDDAAQIKTIEQTNIDEAEKITEDIAENAEEHDEEQEEREEEIEKKKNPPASRDAATSPSSLWSAIGSYKPYNELSNLFMSAVGKEDQWNNYVSSVDRFFAEYYLGVDYCVSWVCRALGYGLFDIAQDEGTAYVETPSGEVQFLGHIEGDRSSDTVFIPCSSDDECENRTYNPNAVCSEDAICEDQSGNAIMMYFYKFTFSVTAPTDEPMTPDRDEYSGEAISFNVFVGNKGPHWKDWADVDADEDLSDYLINRRPLYSGNIGLGNGQNFNDLKMKYSSNEYEAICIKFVKKPWTQPQVPGGEGEVHSICNTFASTDRSYENANAPGAGAPPITYDPNW